jgi:hypothetical protein
MAGREKYERDLTEREWQSSVEQLAKLYGWLCYHTHDSRRSTQGFPDLVLVRERVIFAELKTRSGKLTAAQREWGLRLIAADADYRIWRPADISLVIECLKK